MTAHRQWNVHLVCLCLVYVHAFLVCRCRPNGGQPMSPPSWTKPSFGRVLANLSVPCMSQTEKESVTVCALESNKGGGGQDIPPPQFVYTLCGTCIGTVYYCR